MAEEVGLKLTLDIAKAKSDAEALAKKIEKLSKDFGENSKEVQEAQKQYDDLNKNIKSLSQSQEPLAKQLKEVQKQLQVLKFNGQENTQQYAELIAKAGALKDAMGDTAQAIKLTASDTSNLDAVLGATSAATGGFGLYVSAMSLLGKDTEDVQKSQKKLMQAIALVNSVQQISNALNKDSALMVKLNAVAHKLFAKQVEATAVATNGASTAMKGFKAALVSTGIGALVAALGFAVSKLIDFIEKQKEAKEATDKLAESSANFAKEAGKAYESLNNTQAANKKALDDATKANERYGASLEERKKYLEDDLEANRNARVGLENELKKRQKALEFAQKKEEEYYFKIQQTKVGSTERANLELRLEKARAAVLNYTKAVEEQSNALTDNKVAEQQLLLAQKQLDKEIEDKANEEAEKAIAKAKEYAGLIKEIETNSEEARKKIKDLLTQMVSDDPEQYYKAVTENLKAWLDEQYELEKENNENYIKKLKEAKEAEENAIEKDRHKTDEEKAKEKKEVEEKYNKASETENKRHRDEMMRITYEWQINQQKADDEYSAYLDEKDKKERKAHDEKVEEVKKYLEGLAEAAKQAEEADKIANSPKDPLSVNRARYAEELAILTQYHKDALINEEQFLKAKELLEKKYHIKWEDLNADEKDYYIQKMLDMANYTGSILGSIADMQDESSKEGFERSKQFQSAQTAISTMTGVIGAITSYAREPGGPLGTALGAAAAASILASGIAQVKKIQSTTFSNASSNLGSSAGTSSEHTSTRSESVSNAIISRNIPNAIVQPKTETVLVVDEVTAKQMEQENVKRVSTI